MTVMPIAQVMTAEEFINLPVAEHGRVWSLVEGEVVVNEPTFLHMTILFDLSFALRQWTGEQAGRGTVCLPIDVKHSSSSAIGSGTKARYRPPRRSTLVWAPG